MMFYSQFHEDKNILVPLFGTIGVRNEYCMEVGAMDGRRFSNTRFFLDNGWRGLFIESNDEWARQCRENTAEYGDRVEVVECAVDTKENSLDNILKAAEFPHDFDLCSIDIDGQDYHVWEAMNEYRPRVVIIEFSGDQNQNDFIPQVGGIGQAGKHAIMKLAEKKEYRIVGETDVNFVCVDQHETI
jgi:hypothetical protein